MSMRQFLALALLASLTACGGGDSGGGTAPPPPAANPPPPPPPPPPPTAAETSDIEWASDEPGVTPFIAIVHLAGQDLDVVETIAYEIEPKPGSVSKPVRVTYTMEALDNRGRVMSDEVLLPVFGLYSGYENPISIDLKFDDGSTQTIDDTLTTAAYTDPNGVYDAPVFIKRRAAGSTLGFDFFAMKSGLGTPVIVDRL